MHDRVYNILLSAERPLTRRELASMLHTNDREVRLAIQAARRSGKRICSSPEKKGYWVSKGENDYIAFRKVYMAYPLAMLETVSAMDAYTEGQVEL